ncbi:glycosyltransferase [Candidatus Saccharibacteria bacterium]|nr:glycosyltransferase [Candidatus Saccharibacteria bacterium]
MKIAITSDIYYPMTNGVAVFAHNLANGLAKAGHQVMVVCPSFKDGKPYQEVDEETGVVTVHLKSMRFPFYPDQINKVPEKKELLGLPMPRLVYKHGIWFPLAPYDELAAALNDFQPDVIHLQTAETIALATMRYARRYDVPLVSTGHAYPDNITSQFKMLKPVKRPVDAVVRAYMASFLKHAEYATMPTELAIGDLVPKNRRRFKVPVEALSNGVDLTCFKKGKPNQKVLDKYGIKLKGPRVLYVGRVDPEKSIGNVVQAFAKIAEVIPAARLTIVGDGTDLGRLKELAEDLGLAERVEFPGRIYLPELAEVYQSADVFATASKTETQGIVLIEAAACGLPLVAVDAGAAKELCQNRKNGILCAPDDIEAMAHGLKRILTQPDVKERYGAESLKIAKRHDLSRTLKRFEEIYREAIALKED